MSTNAMRQRFFREMAHGIRLVWPILSGLLFLMGATGVAVGRLEGWPLGDGVYFAFVTGLTIGYGDLVPKGLLARTLAIGIGFCGILLTGLVAAVGVQALQRASSLVSPPDRE